MLHSHLIAKTAPVANEENMIYWKNYRVTVLGTRFFRLEQSECGKFRNEATQAVFYRNMPKQDFTFVDEGKTAVIDTGECKLLLSEDSGQVCVELENKRILLNNAGNLLGTYRTLDNCNGEIYRHWREGSQPKQIELGVGVCSKTGVAVLDDSQSLTLGEDGEVKKEKSDGSDEYIFAFGDDYRGAVQALFSITGKTPLVPRFALGNWWSRYHAYTDKEYLRLLAKFEEREIPLSVATVDMDWHYSESVERQKELAKSGRNQRKFVGECEVNYGWTGYTWNEELFPDYRGFLQKIKEKGLKITLNLHPSDGVRFWDKQYEEMAKAMGMDASTQEYIPFQFSNSDFINAYFDILHRPYEGEGVDFWWMDWQQKNIPFQGGKEGDYDPLWALNHYHYLDNSEGHFTPLLLSRYAGVGSHRYPIGFSGDTVISWETLAYLPYFTATASNIGYTWWSHDIGGHMNGRKEDELYLRHLQYGVFSPINRLHCTNTPTMTKEPWAYQNGNGQIAEEFLRFRHQLVPYLYTASYHTHHDGIPLVQPLYYAWKEECAYRYKEEYLFGSQLLVCPVVTPIKEDGYARIRAWLPKGKWTDIFTGDEYDIPNGEQLTLYRNLNSIPVLIGEGGILPLSADKGNGCLNPQTLEVWAYLGKGEYTLYEDGRERENVEELFTQFLADYTEREGVCTQSLTIFTRGVDRVIPKERILAVRFKNISSGNVRLFVDGVETEIEEWLTDCPAVKIPFASEKTYRIKVSFQKKSRLELWQERAKKILLLAEGDNQEKYACYQALMRATTEEEFVTGIQKAQIAEIAKLRLLENQIK